MPPKVRQRVPNNHVMYNFTSIYFNVLIQYHFIFQRCCGTPSLLPAGARRCYSRSIRHVATSISECAFQRTEGLPNGFEILRARIPYICAAEPKETLFHSRSPHLEPPNVAGSTDSEIFYINLLPLSHCYVCESPSSQLSYWPIPIYRPYSFFGWEYEGSASGPMEPSTSGSVYPILFQRFGHCGTLSSLPTSARNQRPHVRKCFGTPKPFV
jgi:hypothetical protein